MKRFLFLSIFIFKNNVFSPPKRRVERSEQQDILPSRRRRFEEIERHEETEGSIEEFRCPSTIYNALVKSKETEFRNIRMLINTVREQGGENICNTLEQKYIDENKKELIVISNEIKRLINHMVSKYKLQNIIDAFADVAINDEYPIYFERITYYEKLLWIRQLKTSNPINEICKERLQAFNSKGLLIILSNTVYDYELYRELIQPNNLENQKEFFSNVYKLLTTLTKNQVNLFKEN